MTHHAYICDAVRTPIGRYGGALSTVRTDDLAALPIAKLIERNTHVEWERLDDVVLGCANQAGEDNRNVARMASLLAGLPIEVPGTTINRLCASGLDAVGIAARAIQCGDADLMLAGGVESMSRAPYVLSKADTAFSRNATMFDTTIGWRFVNPAMKARYGTDSMPETADNVAEDFSVSRADQDLFALRSQQRYAEAKSKGFFGDEIMNVSIPQRKSDPFLFAEDEHPRLNTSIESLTKLTGINPSSSGVTAGNSSGVNDGACALLLASETAVNAYKLKPLARVIGMAAAGVEPRIMGMGPVPAVNKVLTKAQLQLDQIDLIELNEAFAAQALAVLRELGIPDDAPYVNPQGGAIALGHPLGMSGARLVTTATMQLVRRKLRYALCTMCVGVGQGVAMVIERA